jgi:hypothetical protein
MVWMLLHWGISAAKYVIANSFQQFQQEQAMPKVGS